MRISVTDLESYRYWKASEDATLAELIEKLSHTAPPTPQMAAGRAFAKLMEHAREGGTLDVEQVDGWEFDFQVEGEIALPVVRELKAEVVFDTPHGPVTLVGKVDGYDGKVIDQKLTENVDAERYLDSLQWRAYLVMFGAREFVYDIFRAKYERERGGKDEETGGYEKGTPTGRITVDEHHRLVFYAYPEMRADLERAVCELAEVVATHVAPRRFAQAL